METSYDTILKNINKVANDITVKLGVTGFHIEFPVTYQLEGMQYNGMFIGLMFNIIIFVLIALSTTLIYSLLLLNVDSKKFEFGVLRSLGLSKRGLIQLIFT